MTTPIFITGFEHQVISANGGGLLDSITGAVSIDTTVFNSGVASLKIAPTGASASNARKNLPSGQTILVVSGYIMLDSGNFPSQNTVFFGSLSQTGSIFNGINLSTTGNIRCVCGSTGVLVSSSVTMIPNQQYLIDMRIDQSGTTWTIDWSIDGVAQTQVSATGQTAGNIASIRVGTNQSATLLVGWLDDVIMSITSEDYPIGEHGTEILLPVSDGTHNAGTNIMENQAGTDLGTAYSLIDDLPINGSSEYIRQAGNGTGNYAEVLFGDLVSAHESIIGAMAIICYTSATATTNNGGAIISKDDFSTHTVLHGESGALADYSDGTLASPNFKSAAIDGADTLSEINSLKARVGYSSDTSPNPYWLNLAIEVAYIPGEESNIDLDLVTYSSTINDINILVHELLLLDLVTYSSTVYDINILENELITLDLVSYSSIINNISITESELILLNLVSYSSVFNDINVLENELISLDLISYFSTIYNIGILEHEIVSLDLVSYIYTVNDVYLLEDSDIVLDLVTYLSTIYDISVYETELIPLELVEYTSSIHNISLIESEAIVLDLVYFESVFYDISLTEYNQSYITPISRCYTITEETRIYLIEEEDRIIKIENEVRHILIY